MSLEAPSVFKPPIRRLRPRSPRPRWCTDRAPPNWRDISDVARLAASQDLGIPPDSWRRNGGHLPVALAGGARNCESLWPCRAQSRPGCRPASRSGLDDLDLFAVKMKFWFAAADRRH